MQVRHPVISCQLADLLEAWPQPSLAVDRSGNVVGFAPVLARLLGRNGKEAAPLRLIDAVADDQRPRVAAMLEALNAGECPQRGCDLLSQEGRRFSVGITTLSQSLCSQGILWLSCLDAPSGSATGQLCSASFSPLAQANSGFQLLFDTIPDMLFILDEQGGIMYANNAVRKRLGYTDEELLGSSVLMVHPPEQRAEASQIVQDMLAGEREFCPIPVRSRSGTLIPAETRVVRGEWSGAPALFGVTRDVSEIARSELKFSKAFHSSNVLFAISTVEEGLFLDVNDAFLTTLGYTREEVIGRTSKELGIISQPVQREDIRHRVHEEGGVHNVEVQVRARDGRILTGLHSAELIDLGEQACWLTSFVDLTDRVRLEREMRYRSGFEHALANISTRLIVSNRSNLDSLIVQALAVAGNLVDVDRCYLFLFDDVRQTMSNTHEWCHEGIEPQRDNLQNLPLSLFPWFVERAKQGQATIVDRVEDLQGVADEEYSVLMAQDICSVALVPLMCGPECGGFVGLDSVRRVSKWREDDRILLQMLSNTIANALSRVESDRKLQEGWETYEELVRAVPDLLVQVSWEGQVLGWGNNQDLVPALWPDGAMNASLFDLMRQEDVARLSQALRESAMGLRPQPFEFTRPGEDDTHIYEMRLSRGARDAVVAIIRDVSERVWLEKKKSDFINTATHELRTPITTIGLMVHLLRGNPTPEETKQYWGILENELGREQQLIERLLTVGRLEERRVKLNLRPLLLDEVLQQVVTPLMLSALSRGIHIEYAWDVPVTQVVIADEMALGQCLNNVLGNAIKFSRDNGSIQIKVFARDGQTAISIQDTGIGIPTREVVHMTERFFRGSNAIAEAIPGSGIGLYITRQLLEQMGGHIDAQSKLGQGTRITMWLRAG